MSGGALIVGPYRYSLWRHTGALDASARSMLFVMLNPSTADATTDDATIRRCRGFAVREGMTRFSVVNLFALRSLKPATLWTVADPVGPQNDAEIETMAQSHDVVVAAWGAFDNLIVRERTKAVIDILTDHADVMCLGQAKLGGPRHPLYVKKDEPLRLLFASKANWGPA